MSNSGNNETPLTALQTQLAKARTSQLAGIQPTSIPAALAKARTSQLPDFQAALAKARTSQLSGIQAALAKAQVSQLAGIRGPSIQAALAKAQLVQARGLKEAMATIDKTELTKMREAVAKMGTPIPAVAPPVSPPESRRLPSPQLRPRVEPVHIAEVVAAINAEEAVISPSRCGDQYTVASDRGLARGDRGSC